MKKLRNHKEWWIKREMKMNKMMEKIKKKNLITKIRINKMDKRMEMQHSHLNGVVGEPIKMKNKMNLKMMEERGWLLMQKTVRTMKNNEEWQMNRELTRLLIQLGSLLIHFIPLHSWFVNINFYIKSIYYNLKW